MGDVRFSLITGWALAGCAAVAGCESWNTVKVDNPVFGPAPQRLSMIDDRTQRPAFATKPDGSAEPKDEVLRVGLTNAEGLQEDDPLDTQVVATVNGEAVFAFELLDRYATHLTQVRDKASPEEIRQLREMLIRRDLPDHVSRVLLTQSLRTTFKKEQLEMLQKHLDKMFEAEVQRLMKELKVTSTTELDQELQKQQTSLSNLRTTFMNQRMAIEFLGVQSKSDKEIGRQELYSYYQSHIDEYSFPAQVKWQQIVVTYNRHGGKQKAFENVLKKAIDELREGADFAEVARRYSDGPTASEGGHWGWTTLGSLADKELEQMLFELEPDTISQVMVGRDSFQIVRVLGRKQAGVRPFAELQDEIKQKLEQEARQTATRKVLEELKAKAVIESPFLETRRDTPALPFK